MWCAVFFMLITELKAEWEFMKRIVKKVKRKYIRKPKLIINERNTMSEFDLVSAVVAAINADIAAGNGNFSVALSPDSTQVVLTSSPVVAPASKTETFAVTNPTQPA